MHLTFNSLLGADLNCISYSSSWHNSSIILLSVVQELLTTKTAATSSTCQQPPEFLCTCWSLNNEGWQYSDLRKKLLELSSCSFPCKLPFWGPQTNLVGDLTTWTHRSSAMEVGTSGISQALLKTWGSEKTEAEASLHSTWLGWAVVS